MNILSTALEVISDSLLFFIISYTAYIIQYNIYTDFLIYKKRILIAFIISGLISILLSQNYFGQLTFLKFILIILNYSKYILLTAFVYKNFSVKSVLIFLIIQILPTTVTTGLLALVPDKMFNYHLFNISLLLVVRLIILGGFILIKYKIDYSSMQMLVLTTPSHIYLLIMLALFLSEALNQTVNYITSDINKKIELIKILASLHTICTIIIILSLLLSVAAKKYQSDINDDLKKQIETQIYHYEQLEKLNAEIRRFKHDYINHIKCMSSMAANKEYDDLIDYIDKLSASFPVSAFLFETGNYIADAILTEKQVNSPDNILIKFDGVIPANIDNIDLCIILSNAVDNAVEACCLYDGDRIINVYSGFKHGYFVLKIKNPTVNIAVSNKSVTTKSDKINHGFGLDNIKRTVKKYDGYVSMTCEDNIFTLNITFSNISEK